jgi:hypothetical protein
LILGNVFKRSLQNGRFRIVKNEGVPQIMKEIRFSKMLVKSIVDDASSGMAWLARRSKLRSATGMALS